AGRPVHERGAGELPAGNPRLAAVAAGAGWNTRTQRRRATRERRAPARDRRRPRGCAAGDRGSRIWSKISGRAVHRTKDRRVPRSAREPAFRRERGAWPRAGLFQLSRLVRAPPGKEGYARDRARRIWTGADARGRERYQKLAHEYLVRGSECVRLLARERAGRNHLRY